MSDHPIKLDLPFDTMTILRAVAKSNRNSLKALCELILIRRAQEILEIERKLPTSDVVEAYEARVKPTPPSKGGHPKKVKVQVEDDPTPVPPPAFWGSVIADLKDAECREFWEWAVENRKEKHSLKDWERFREQAEATIAAKGR